MVQQKGSSGARDSAAKIKQDQQAGPTILQREYVARIRRGAARTSVDIWVRTDMSDGTVAKDQLIMQYFEGAPADSIEVGLQLLAQTARHAISERAERYGGYPQAAPPLPIKLGPEPDPDAKVR